LWSIYYSRPIRSHGFYLSSPHCCVSLLKWHNSVMYNNIWPSHSKTLYQQQLLLKIMCCTCRTRLYVHEGTKEPSIEWYFRPFSAWTWLALIAGLLLFTSINTLLHYIMNKLHGSTESTGFLSNLFTIVTIMLQQGKSSLYSISLKYISEEKLKININVIHNQN
jgi:hypothetical protein